MANIKNLQMWKSICADARIGVSKTLFGLCVKVVYKPTNSVLNAKVLEYSQDDGERLKHILESPVESLARAIEDFHPKAIINGNYLAEMCVSEDGTFVAVQLLQFSQLNYVPVTDVLIYEKGDASVIVRLFQKGSQH